MLFVEGREAVGGHRVLGVNPFLYVDGEVAIFDDCVVWSERESICNVCEGIRDSEEVKGAAEDTLLGNEIVARFVEEIAASHGVSSRCRLAVLLNGAVISEWRSFPEDLKRGRRHERCFFHGGEVSAELAV
ncbi:hypothetical protein BHM03_00006711 [Ensete ventricosum]|nr:hypothetical protein BHM03_00006711 [Ensete ventricosum]